MIKRVWKGKEKRCNKEIKKKMGKAKRRGKIQYKKVLKGMEREKENQNYRWEERGDKKDMERKEKYMIEREEKEKKEGN